MSDPYWFWLTFPGGVVLGLIALSPFAIGYGIYSWIKSEREKREKAIKIAEFKEQMRKLREGRK